MDCVFPANQRVKIKESEKTDKCLDLTRELKKKLWNMRIAVIPVVTRVLETVPKSLEKSLEGLEIRRIETIHTTTWC